MNLKAKWYPKSKVEVNELNLSDKVKNLDLLKGSSLLKTWQSYREKNESSNCSIVWNSILIILSFFSKMVSLEAHAHRYLGSGVHNS
jgi:hypothetical protein